MEQLDVIADRTLHIFAREQSISDENRFTVYGFSELGKRMRAMAMLVMIESITAKIKYNQSDGVATWVYVDEMHELWGEEYSLHALEKMWREVRKRGGICTGMSQNLIDAKRNRSTKTMVSNSEFMLLLDQGTMDKEAVEDLFAQSEEDEEENPELANARALVERHYAAKLAQGKWQQVAAALARRGFSHSVIRQALADAETEETEA